MTKKLVLILLLSTFCTTLPGATVPVYVDSTDGSTVSPPAWSIASDPSSVGDFDASAWRTDLNLDQGFINVKWLGAVGDGVTDDTSAIQTALNAGGAVFIPSGTYIVSDLSISVDGTTLMGVGYDSVLKRDPNAVGSIRVIRVNKGGAKYLSDITIKDIRVDGSKATAGEYTLENEGIDADNTERLTIQNCWIHDCGQDAIDVDGGNIGLIIQNNRIYDNAGNGIHTYGVKNGDISNNWIYNGGDGWDFATHNGVIAEPRAINFIVDPDTGLTSDERRPERNTVSGNKIDNYSIGIGIDSDTAIDCVVSNNVISNIYGTTGVGINIQGERTKVVANQIYTCTEQGIKISGAEHLITGNHVEACLEKHIDVFNADDVVVVGNTVVGAVDVDAMHIRINSERCVATGNNLNGSASSGVVAGIRIEGPNATVTGNYLSHRFALVLASSGSSYVVEGNKCVGTSTDFFISSALTPGGVIANNHTPNGTGQKAKAEGTGSIAVGATTNTVNHGLWKAPTRVVITPTTGTNTKTIWVTNITDTQFTVNADVDPTTAYQWFDWYAERDQ
jgi:hypothetical protein